ncbi:tRNA-dihydrouridine(16) synthase [[Clostridium] scindens]|uniref:tRNA dihydrouridine synthase n=1 Tax=Clostridium scindens (strain JCM 10418 / VPI 12708) TaxID=29347 RepID=UPI00298D1ABD|nr:tRNA-dihydrouridine synthase family protein [[Clostridium] scindens]WPB47861.1 tRNA-dihydrouridine(16) synthase [[Clostridium] scindens]
MIRYYLAPLEGITTHIYRRAYHACFHPMDKYFTPFLVPHTKRGFNTRELNDILPENNEGMRLVPQILTNDAKGFLQTVKKLEDYGYKEVNLNLGCPSKTVVSKNRGSGFLAMPEELDRFLNEIYEGTEVKISIKTRIGKHSPEEFGRLLEIYNQYPVEELIIHPRLQQDFYKNTPNLEVFAEAVRGSRNPLCYNGDIFSASDMDRMKKEFPEVKTYMLGRGILVNPGLAGELAGEGPADRGRIRVFHDRIYEDYQKISMGDKNVLFKMKELWCYMGHHFPGSEKQLKKIRKAERLDRYEAAVAEIL